MSEQRVRSVSWLLRQISSCISRDPVLHNVIIEGELSNFTAHSSGHWYFSLKDEHASIRAVMWENDNLLVNFAPKTGDKLLVLGDVKIYPAAGSLQLVVRKMAPAGAGDLKAQFDALYKKLEEEGLFRPEHKKPIPRYPMRIALVAGRETHARADVLNTLHRRWPAAEVTEFSALVQGNRAAADMIAQLRKADQMGFDVILLCRGGGSQEDLWCFNDEQLSRTIYGLRTPLVTGVGHEPDWTMVDYVADLRAPTPTGAAERCSPDIVKVREQLSETGRALLRLTDARLEEERFRLDNLSACEVFENPAGIVEKRRLRKEILSEKLAGGLSVLTARLAVRLKVAENQLTASCTRRIETAGQKLRENHDALLESMETSVSENRKKLAVQAGLLDAYSPLRVLERGYSVVSKNGTVIRDAGRLEENDEINIRLYRGMASAVVKAVKKGESDGKETDI
jgi:exodeoxyribonuclease VII large subunit